MGNDIKIVVDDAKVRKAINEAEGTESKLQIITQQVVGKANALGAGYRTGKYHRDHQSPAVGGTQPEYGGDVKRKGSTPVGIVHPENYAAMKDNHMHNTMLKAL